MGWGVGRGSQRRPGLSPFRALRGTRSRRTHAGRLLTVGRVCAQVRSLPRVVSSKVGSKTLHSVVDLHPLRLRIFLKENISACFPIKWGWGGSAGAEPVDAISGAVGQLNRCRKESFEFIAEERHSGLLRHENGHPGGTLRGCEGVCPKGLGNRCPASVTRFCSDDVCVLCTKHSRRFQRSRT